VLFADMLGFASLTEAHGASRDEFAAFDRPDTNEFLTMALEVDEASPLVASFVRFHVAVDDAVAFARKQGGSLTSITFSDSAFVAVENFQTASTLAISPDERAAALWNHGASRHCLHRGQWGPRDDSPRRVWWCELPAARWLPADTLFFLVPSVLRQRA
jgi:hypothetical protein